MLDARMPNPAIVIPEAMQALIALNKATRKGGVPDKVLELVHLRASQINGCSACVDSGAKTARKAGNSDDRLIAVSAWRESPYFDEAERAALALTEEATRLADKGEAVPDEVWEAAAKHFDEKGMAAVILTIALTNAFNRLNATTRQPAGQAW
ncbi:carboxymuconolactone decarboxylase family protein [Catelliglobosispora koreensis]|uniref:carboxymuconolactone decarboxylase family protein n=1 Tax=Catelliglobosispora koreensis TaxID=129052 RepID=UPI00035CCC2F|nr:carboxymuconolactone decarboxylase family protein [Catelliglobosispora koreensis]